MLTATQQRRLDALVPLSAGETITSAAASFRAACVLEFGAPGPGHAEVEAALREREAAEPQRQ